MTTFQPPLVLWDITLWAENVCISENIVACQAHPALGLFHLKAYGGGRHVKLKEGVGDARKNSH